VVSGASIAVQPSLAHSLYSAITPNRWSLPNSVSQPLRGLNTNFLRMANEIVQSPTVHVAVDTRPATGGQTIGPPLWSGSRLVAVPVRDVSVFRTSILPIHSFTKLLAAFGAEPSSPGIPSVKPGFELLGRNALGLSRNAAFRPIRSFTAGMTPHDFFRADLNGLVRHGVSGAATGFPKNARVLAHNRIEYGFDLLPILGMGRGHNSEARSGPSLGTRFGYLMVTNSY
jgi:hypothetical protein